MITVIVYTLPVFYYEKMMGYTLSSFADLVFIDEWIEMGLKRGKFNHPAWTNEKTGANEEGENEGETHVATVILTWPNFPPTQQCQYSANISSSHYLPPSHPQRPSLNQSQNQQRYSKSNYPQTNKWPKPREFQDTEPIV